MQTWIKIDKNSDFSIYNLPFGVYSTGKQKQKNWNSNWRSGFKPGRLSTN